MITNQLLYQMSYTGKKIGSPLANTEWKLCVRPLNNFEILSHGFRYLGFIVSKPKTATDQRRHSLAIYSVLDQCGCNDYQFVRGIVVSTQYLVAVGRTRTSDLLVMSQSRCLFSTPQNFGAGNGI